MSLISSLFGAAPVSAAPQEGLRQQAEHAKRYMAEMVERQNHLKESDYNLAQQATGLGPVQRAMQNHTLLSAPWSGSNALNQGLVGSRQVLHKDTMLDRVTKMNTDPTYCTSLKDACTLFAARWGNEWVYIPDEVVDDGAVDWRKMSQRLVNAERMEVQDGCHKLIERDHGNS